MCAITGEMSLPVSTASGVARVRAARFLQQTGTFPEADEEAFDEAIAALFVDRQKPAHRANRCSYECVDCDGEGGYALSFYYMPAFSLGGTLAAALGNCKGLTFLGLAARGITGTVPAKGGRTARRAGLLGGANGARDSGELA